MIAEENFLYNLKPNISIHKSDIILLIIHSIKQTIPFFKSYINSDFIKKKNLSEDNFSQIFIEQNQILLRKFNYPFNISSQYKDHYNQSKGVPDIYFYPNENEITTSPLFIAESKRLPAPSKDREKEYVFGDKKNGGIERFKTEKHGKGFNNCGLLGFLEKENSGYWANKINKWIIDLANVNNTWKKDEILSTIETNSEYCYLKSKAYRERNDIILHHLWIIFN